MSLFASIIFPDNYQEITKEINLIFEERGHLLLPDLEKIEKKFKISFSKLCSLLSTLNFEMKGFLEGEPLSGIDFGDIIRGVLEKNRDSFEKAEKVEVRWILVD